MAFTGQLNGVVQTDYFAHPPQTKPGLIEFPSQPKRINGYPVASDFIYCGTAVFKGNSITIPAEKWGSVISPFHVIAAETGLTDADFVGVLVWDGGARNDETGRAGKQMYDMAGIMESGYIGVKLFENTVQGAQAYCVLDPSNTVNAPVGSWVSTALGGAAIAIPNASWWATYTVADTPYGILQLV